MSEADMIFFFFLFPKRKLGNVTVASFKRANFLKP